MDQQPNLNFQSQMLADKPNNNTWQKLVLAVVCILLVSGLGFGSFYLWKNYQDSHKDCPAETMRCADGTKVGRVASKCYFAACPGENRNYFYTIDECSIIDFSCDAGQEYFKNNLGCGCQPVSISEIDKQAVNWQTYRNGDLGPASFEINYPASYSIVSRMEDSVTFEKPINCVAGDNCFPAKLEIKHITNMETLTVEDWFGRYDAEHEKVDARVISGQDVIVVVPKNTELSATRYIFGSPDQLPSGASPMIFDIWVYSGIDLTLADQILATFKFIPQ